MTMRDPIFELKGDFQWNACIGEQGSKENYLDGYIEAATVLAEAIIEGKMYGKRDTLILPILYNTRHAIELTLKFTIDQLVAMGVLGRAHPRDHDIMSHWKVLASNNLGDETLRQSVLKLEPFVLSLSRIDDDGQELRYPENTVGDKSLSDIALVNLVVVRDSLAELSKTLTELKGNPPKNEGGLG
jgi:hypothetical protein